MGRVRLHMDGTRELLLVLALTGFGGAGLSGQQPEPASSDRVVRAAAPRYDASGVHEFLFGKEYRSLWSTPVSVPLLNLRAVAGGLKPVSKGGGQQTKSLLFSGRDGREFFFRSVDKDPSAVLPAELRANTGSFRNSQTSPLRAAPPQARLATAAVLMHASSSRLRRRGLTHFIQVGFWRGGGKLS